MTNAECSIIKQLSDLPKRYRMKAIENFLSYRKEAIGMPVCRSIHEALNFGFDWENSPQRSVYWSRIYKSMAFKTN